MSMPTILLTSTVIVMVGVLAAYYRRSKGFSLKKNLPEEIWFATSWCSNDSIRQSEGHYCQCAAEVNGVRIWEKRGRQPRWIYFSKGKWRLTTRLPTEDDNDHFLVQSLETSCPIGVWITPCGEVTIAATGSLIKGEFEVGEVIETSVNISPTIPKGSSGRVCGIAEGSPQHLTVIFGTSLQGKVALATECIDRLEGPKVTLLCSDLIWREGYVCTRKRYRLKVRYSEGESEWLPSDSPRLIKGTTCPTSRENVIINESFRTPKTDPTLKAGDEGVVLSDKGPFVHLSYRVKSKTTGKIGLYARNELLVVQVERSQWAREVIKCEQKCELPSSMSKRSVQMAANHRMQVARDRLEHSHRIISSESSADEMETSEVVETPQLGVLSTNPTGSFSSSVGPQTFCLSCNDTQSEVSSLSTDDDDDSPSLILPACTLDVRRNSSNLDEKRTGGCRLRNRFSQEPVNLGNCRFLSLPTPDYD